MPLLVHLKDLETRNVPLIGEMSPAELELEHLDELIKVSLPLTYALEVQKMEEGLLVHGKLNLLLDCECSRCLKPFQEELNLEEWACHIPLVGEPDEIAPILNDSVDLTPYIREDILLGFPQHPLCKKECSGLPPGPAASAGSSGASQTSATSSAWSELNKLKF